MSSGLSFKFNTTNGRFGMTDGKDKARDNIYFTCTFDVVRPYEPYFGSKVLSLLHSIEQKAVSTIMQISPIVSRQIEEAIISYNDYIRINNVEIGYLDSDRKHYGVSIDYSYVGSEPQNSFTDVIFI